MEEIIKTLELKGFDLLYSDSGTVDHVNSDPISYMIWMKNKRYFLLQCSIDAINDLTSKGVKININHWLSDLTYDDIKKLSELELPNFKETVREIRLKKLLGK